MHWLIELSGEHPTLPSAEAIACFEALKSRATDIEVDGALMTFAAEAKSELVAERLAMSHFVNEEIAVGTFEDILAASERLDLAGARFMVRAPARGGSVRKSVEEKIGKALARTGKVDLRQPEVTFRVNEGKKWHLSKVLSKVNRTEFERRRPVNRPFKKPVMLHPRLARALVNLSRVSYGGRLLDPFCGTGGILLEASLVGAEVIGSDIDSEMVAGSRKTLSHFKRTGRLILADVGKLPSLVEKVDAIATDPPYGRASSTKSEPIESLYPRAFEAFGRLLKPGAHVAICLPEERHATMAGPDLRLEETYPVRVHGSLTRHFTVFSKSP